MRGKAIEWTPRFAVGIAQDAEHSCLDYRAIETGAIRPRTSWFTNDSWTRPSNALRSSATAGPRLLEEWSARLPPSSTATNSLVEGEAESQDRSIMTSRSEPNQRRTWLRAELGGGSASVKGVFPDM